MAGEVDWYTFTAAADATYYVQWDDGDHDYTKIDLVVSAYLSDGSPLFTNVDHGYNSPRSLSLSAAGTVYVRVEGYSSYSTGAYAIRYYQ